MNREILKKYDALKDEQEDVKKRIGQLQREMNVLLNSQVADTVKGTRPDGTYGSIKIKGVPFAEYDKKKELLQKRLDRFEAIEAELESMTYDIEVFISKLDSSRVRMILRLKYLDGLSWRAIAKRYGKESPSWPYQKVEKYFKKVIDEEKSEQ